MSCLFYLRKKAGDPLLISVYSGAGQEVMIRIMLLTWIKLSLQRLFCLLVLFLLASVSAHAALIKRDSPLLEAPSVRSAEVGSVVVGVDVEYKQRKGLWAEVCARDLCGWLRITAVELNDRQGATKTNLANLKSGREGVGNAVSSTGVRGLDAEAIELGRPDYGALAVLEGYRVSVADADAFAQQGLLATRSMVMLVSSADSARVTDARRGASPQLKRNVNKKKKNKRKEASDDDW
jgi:hypothetical protein